MQPRPRLRGHPRQTRQNNYAKPPEIGPSFHNAILTPSCESAKRYCKSIEVFMRRHYVLRDWILNTGSLVSYLVSASTELPSKLSTGFF
jgi:hypothetical protein